MLPRGPAHAGRLIASNADAGRLGCFGITGVFYASATFWFLSSCARRDPPDGAHFVTGIVNVGTLCGVPSTRHVPIKT